jgi:hypothetical protein
MTSTNIDYINNYFQYPELTPIHGEPTYESLQTIKDQLKTNATGVVASIGGGAHGHLGAVLTAEEYSRISQVPYVAPDFPVLTLPPSPTGPVISQLTRQFTEDMRCYREALDIRKALIKQIVAAIEPRYLKTLRNTDTHSITQDVPTVLTYLFNRYGKVTPDKLNEKEQEVRAFVYNLQDPLVLLFDQVEDLKKLADAAQMPYTTRQIVNFGVQLIRNTHDFQDGLKAWYDIDEADKTWPNFKILFEDEHDKLRLVRGETMQHAGFHQANFIAAQVKDEIQSVQTNVLQLLQHQEDKENSPPDTDKENKANAAMNTDPSVVMQMEMLKLIKSLQKEVNDMKSNKGGGRGGNRNNQGRRFTHLYCWSHGACGHKGRDCRWKKEGHKDEASFKNKMGGSMRYCQDCNDE